MVRNKDEEENGKFRLVSEIQIIYQSVHPLNMHIESEEKKNRIELWYTCEINKNGESLTQVIT